MKRTIFASIFGLVTAVTLLPGPADAQPGNLIQRQDFWIRPAYFLIRFGFVSGEAVRLNGQKIDGQPGATFGVAWDIRAWQNTFIGISTDIHRMHVSDSGQYFFDLCLNAKQHIFAKSAEIGFKPGLSLGFGVMDYFAGVERTTYMTWKTSFEVIFYGGPKSAWYFDLGLMGTALGGNSEHKVRFGPFPYLRGGVMF